MSDCPDHPDHLVDVVAVRRALEEALVGNDIVTRVMRRLQPGMLLEEEHLMWERLALRVEIDPGMSQRDAYTSIAGRLATDDELFDELEVRITESVMAVSFVRNVSVCRFER
jgi:hypothetical protein